MQETLQEYVDSRGASIQVDAGRGVIRGVKILGLSSRNGRVYRPEALVGAAGLYDGAKVHVNHAPHGDPGPRNYQDRIGAIRNVVARHGDGLFADFHFNPKHVLAEQLLWDAEHAPENMGFSHNVQAKTSRQGDTLVVEEILAVESVDLVADPATTRGLFEAAPAAPCAAASPARAESTAGSPNALAQVTEADLRVRRPDLVSALLQPHEATIAQLREEIQQLRAAEDAAARRALARRLLREHGLPDPDDAQAGAGVVLSPTFLQSLWDAPTEEAVRRLVEDRAALVQSAGLAAAAPSRLSRAGRTPLAVDPLAAQTALAAEPADPVRAFVAAVARSG